MRDRASHYAAADRLLEEARDTTAVWAHGARERMLSAAIAHALLASAPGEVLGDVMAAENTNTRVPIRKVREAP